MKSERPLLTYAIVAYKQERFLREAVQSAFAQTYSPLEIILSDDCSPDGTWSILQEMAASYKGPHRVLLNRTNSNSGLADHVNSVVNLAHGELIVIAAGDDISLPERTETMYRAWVDSNFQAMSITSSAIKIDSSGKRTGEVIRGRHQRNTPNLATRAKNGCWTVLGCSHAWHRRVFEFFGPLQPYVFAEDRAIEFRAWALGTVALIEEPLVLYRVHGSNMAALRREASAAERREMQLKMLKARTSMFEQFQADLRVMGERRIENAAEIFRAEKWIKRNLVLVEKEQLYLANPTVARFWQVACLKLFYKPLEGCRWIKRGFAP